MLILLPPSEGKNPPRAGGALDLSTLSYPALTDARATVLAALAQTSARPDALERLRVPTGAAGAVAANVVLDRAPTAPASRVYAGVLYEAFDVSALPPAAASRAAASVLIFSALFGVLRLDDRIPAYRASAASRLVGLGTAGTFWRGHLADVLADERLVVDARSGGYSAMWRPGRALAVRVFSEADGRRRPVSHWAKQARGYVARALVEAEASPRTPDEALDVVCAAFAVSSYSTADGRTLELSATLASDGRAIEVLTH